MVVLQDLEQSVRGWAVFSALPGTLERLTLTRRLVSLETLRDLGEYVRMPRAGRLQELRLCWSDFDVGSAAGGQALGHFVSGLQQHRVLRAACLGHTRVKPVHLPRWLASDVFALGAGADAGERYGAYTVDCVLAGVLVREPGGAQWAQGAWPHGCACCLGREAARVGGYGCV